MGEVQSLRLSPDRAADVHPPGRGKVEHPSEPGALERRARAVLAAQVHPVKRIHQFYRLQDIYSSQDFIDYKTFILYTFRID